MKPVQISDAKDLAYKLRASGVLVIQFGDGQVGTASYGMTREKCDALKKINESVFQLFRSGEIEVPECLQ